ncbi:isoleucine--tRNA ligase [Pseudothermotoga thermarum]|uniref:isoleucine--tRNA ligase n=1 Tax=Pseudothermotoga thermarum TaxID=119394 RepID=UPI00059D38B6|nr:isoleucine--tRNA ligase [Pseudothermotoga thermarum]
MEYKDTLNLPSTDFPMRANLVEKEPRILEKWKKIDVYRYLLKQRENCPTFILHDGPPYANGAIHIGTASNKILKDIVVKYKIFQGYKSPYVPGWDTHGLPIEHKVTTMLGEKAKTMSAIQIRKACEEFAKSQIEMQKKQFQRLGVIGDWENYYATLTPDYEYKIYEVFEKLVEDGYIYRARKPVLWCMNCQTALAQAEIEYYDHVSPSIYVKFKMKDSENEYIVIWTTTPWTLPGNTGVAVHPDHTYVKVEVNGEIWIVAEKLLQSMMKELGINEYKVVEKFNGKELNGKLALHPLYERTSRIITADYVDMETGTGCVHIAPGHGEEDYEYGYLIHGLEVLSPVDEAGNFTPEAGKYSGMNIVEANDVIIEDLRKIGALLKASSVSHSYPHCWRCKNPVIFRATDQWFISIDRNNLRKRILEQIEKVKWVPDWGKNRISAMIEERPDWCISRQRVWGVPIPAFKCKDCGHVSLTPQTVRHFAEIVKEKGTNAWFELEEEQLLPPGFVCPNCGSRNFSKMMDTLDVWIDSGASFEAVLNNRPDLSFPADMYLEGSDQHRGWFNSSIVLSVVKHGVAPYKIVLTHGFIKDEEGKKMSKSLGNVVDPLEICSKYGADVLRLWLASSDYFNDIRISEKIILQQVEVYKKLRNTIRYLLANLNDFDEKQAVPYEKLLPIDKWALGRLQQIVKSVTDAYEDYEFSRAYNILVKYCSVELSSVYLDIIKDRLYVEGKNSLKRKSAQTVLYEILKSVLIMLAPILTFTCEEAYEHFRGKKFETIFAETWPKYHPEWVDEKLLADFDKLMEVRDVVLKKLEEARQNDLIGHSLDAKVTIKIASKDYYELLEKYSQILEEFLIVSQVKFTKDGGTSLIKVEVDKADGQKCERCWKYHPMAGFDPRFPKACPRCVEVLSSEG